MTKKQSPKASRARMSRKVRGIHNAHMIACKAHLRLLLRERANRTLLDSLLSRLSRSQLRMIPRETLIKYAIIRARRYQEALASLT